MSEVIDKIKALNRFKENWDSYGGLPVNQHCAAVALRIADSLDGLDDVFDSCPNVVLCSDGGISLEYGDGQNEIEIIISPKRTE